VGLTSGTAPKEADRLQWRDRAGVSPASEPAIRARYYSCGLLSTKKEPESRQRLAPAALLRCKRSPARSGINLGDGALAYGSERIVEAYSRYMTVDDMHVTAVYQTVVKLGYNNTTVPLVALRLHAELCLEQAWEATRIKLKKGWTMGTSSFEKKWQRRAPASRLAFSPA
jgi:hypothetical protein